MTSSVTEDGEGDKTEVRRGEREWTQIQGDILIAGVE